MKKSLSYIITFLLTIFVSVNIVNAKVTSEINKANVNGDGSIDVIVDTAGDTVVTYSDTNVSCGNGMIKSIPSRFPKITSSLITFFQVAIPIMIIVFGMIDLLKGVVAQKEDEIKKGQKVFFSRLFTGILVFFIVFFAKMLIRFVDDKSSANIASCIDCFVSNKCY